MKKTIYQILFVLIILLFSSCSLEDLLSDGRINIETPEDGQKLNSRSITIEGDYIFTGERDEEAEAEITSDIFYVKIIVNGHLPETIGSSSEEIEFNVTTTLQEGENKITVIGYYLKKKIREKEIYVYCDTKPPVVTISSSYTHPVTDGSLIISGTVETHDLTNIEYKTTYVNRSDPDNPVTTETAYKLLPYETSDQSDTGTWAITYQNISSTPYVDESSIGDLLTISIRVVDDVDNGGSISKQFELFAQ
ncbi:MAG: hypothetical protein PF637_01840 [Spirochaetes bacterium]|jgi:hypothetical protein|nr:hypothetical protein [Spirochaetota bacterium]